MGFSRSGLFRRVEAMVTKLMFLSWDYFNLLSLVLLLFCHPVCLVLHNPKCLNFSHVAVSFFWYCSLLSLGFQCLELCNSGFGSEPQQHAARFLVSYDPPVTHFLLPSLPATLAPGRQTIHPVPQRFPITHKLHTCTELTVFWVHLSSCMLLLFWSSEHLFIIILLNIECFVRNYCTVVNSPFTGKCPKILNGVEIWRWSDYYQGK